MASLRFCLGLALANVTDARNWFFALLTAIPNGLHRVANLCGVAANFPFCDESVFKIIVNGLDGMREDPVDLTLGPYLVTSLNFSLIQSESPSGFF